MVYYFTQGNDLDEFYTTKELGSILKVTSRTIINMIKSGKIRAVIVGGSKRTTFRIYKKELDRFMAVNYARGNHDRDD
jgi:excisionase family DNA binding protein